MVCLDRFSTQSCLTILVELCLFSQYNRITYHFSYVLALLVHRMKNKEKQIGFAISLNIILNFFFMKKWTANIMILFTFSCLFSQQSKIKKSYLESLMLS